MNCPNKVSAAADHPVHHSEIEANGASFHVVQQERGPVVLFLHGFPREIDRRGQPCGGASDDPAVAQLRLLGACPRLQ